MFKEDASKLSVTGGPAAGPIVVTSEAVSLEVLFSPPPETVTVFVIVAGALPATCTVSVSVDSWPVLPVHRSACKVPPAAGSSNCRR